MVAADGVVSGETVQVGTGIFATSARAIAAAIQRDGLERSAEQRLRNNNTPGKGRFELGPLTELSDAYSVTAKFVFNARVKLERGRTYSIPTGLPIQVGPGNYLLGVRIPDRTMPFVCLAGTQIEEIEIVFADGLPLPNQVRGRTVETRVFSYRSDYGLNGRTFKVRRQFVSKVPGQACAPEIEAEIASPMLMVQRSLATRMRFAAETPPTQPRSRPTN
jgi:hypothetical protein